MPAEAHLDLGRLDPYSPDLQLRVEAAEQINCQSANYQTDGGVAYNFWGDNGEVFFWYRLRNRKIGGISPLSAAGRGLGAAQRPGRALHAAREAAEGLGEVA